jgi:Ca2+-binding RTX toxin-like protein
MFGLNALTTVEATDDVLMHDRYRELEVTNLRFPGGSVTEWYFDISDALGGSHDNSFGSYQGNERPLTTFTAFIELAAELDASATLVVPTMNGFTQTAGEALAAGNYGQRVISADYLADVEEFIGVATGIAQAHGVDITAIEIGNEFWASGQMAAAEYGKLAAAMSHVIATTLADLDAAPEDQPDIVVQTTSSAGFMSPRSEKTVYVDTVTSFIYLASDLANLDDDVAARLNEVVIPAQGNARVQARDIIASFEQAHVLVESAQGDLSEFDIPGVANAIDGVVDHYYVDGGFDVVNTGEQYGFNQLELWNAELHARDTALPDLDYYITEWNTRKNGILDEANNRGLQQVSMNIEIFYEMVTHDVTAAHFWPAIFNLSNSGTLVHNTAESLTLAGEGFSLMSSSLVGLTPVLDFKVSGEYAIHGYGDEDTRVLLFSERSGSENVLEMNLTDVTDLDTAYYRVSWTELWDGGVGGTDGAAQPVISHTQLSDVMTIQDFDDFLLTMQAWSVVKMEIEGFDILEVGDTVSDGDGRAGRTVVGDDAGALLRGGPGDDVIIGGTGNNTISGYEGDDSISGGSTNDMLKGGWGDDTLRGNEGDDILKGDWGNDVLIGGSGTDTLVGGTGSDRFVIGPVNGSRNTIMDFEFGIDLIDLSQAPAGSFADLSILWSDNRIRIEDEYGTVLFLEGMSESSVDHFAATDFIFQGQNSIVSIANATSVAPVGLDANDNDDMRGGSGPDLLRGDAGHNLLAGLQGFDTLNGGAGNDTLQGNLGNDVMSGGADDDLLIGGIGSDVMSGDGGNDLLQGQGGFDTLNGGDGADTLQGNNSNDLLNGGAGDDLLEGGFANDVLNGEAGNDTLEGGNGFDLLNGGDGDDRLEGNAGSDTLDGGAGTDVLRGGLGADTFVFRLGSGNDRIVDFGNVDAVALEAALLGGGNPDAEDLRDISSLDADGFLLLDFGGGDTLTFTGITNTGAILDDVSFI